METYKLLVIDDVSDERGFLRDGLERICDNVYVDELSDFTEARDMVEGNDYELVIFKWNESDGKNFLKWVRKHPDKGAIPVITFSDIDNKDGVMNSVKLGANAFLIEPFSIDKLIQKIIVLNERLDRRRFGRCKASNPVLLKFKNSYADGELMDISRGGIYGIFIFEDTLPAILEKVIVNLEYENRPEVFEVFGVILRIEVSDIFETSTSLKISIKFSDLSDEQREKLNGFILSLESCGEDRGELTLVERQEPGNQR